MISLDCSVMPHLLRHTLLPANGVEGFFAREMRLEGVPDFLARGACRFSSSRTEHMHPHAVPRCWRWPWLPALLLASFPAVGSALASEILRVVVLYCSRSTVAFALGTVSRT